MDNTGFGAKRHNVYDGHYWIDTASISCIRERSQELANENDRRCGINWAKDNPIIEIVKIKIEEITE